MMKGFENSELHLSLASLKKPVVFSKPTDPVTLSLCSFLSELVLLDKIDLCCATVMQGFVVCLLIYT